MWPRLNLLLLLEQPESEAEVSLVHVSRTADSGAAQWTPVINPPVARTILEHRPGQPEQETQSSQHRTHLSVAPMTSDKPE